MAASAVAHDAVIVGDFNLDAEQVEALAKQLGGRLAKGRGPDHAIIIGAELLSVRRLGRHGSDHHEAILYNLAVDGKRRRVLSWNVWEGQAPGAVLRTLKQLVRSHDPDVIVLQEAYRLTDVLRELDGYWVHQGPNVGEGADVAVLVSREHEVANDGVLKMSKPWTVVSHDKVRDPREYPFVRVRFDDGSTLRVLGYHGPTKHAVNAAAVDESIDHITSWAKPRTKEKS